jgi:hypothetical protein
VITAVATKFFCAILSLLKTIPSGVIVIFNFFMAYLANNNALVWLFNFDKIEQILTIVPTELLS